MKADNFLAVLWQHRCLSYNFRCSPLNAAMAERLYKPSEQVPVSGVYRVDHNGHRDSHEATLLEGEMFPPCAVCEDRVRFVLKYRAGGIHLDKDFPQR